VLRSASHARRRPGRPSKLTQLNESRLVDALRKGNHRKVAAAYAGISEATFHRWMSDQRPDFRDFQAVVEQAEAEAEVEVVGNLVEASKRNYRAGVEWLERRAPDRWRPDRELDPPVADYVPEGIAEETPVEPSDPLSTFPEELIHPFAMAARQFERTGVLPAWVERGEQERDGRMAQFRETGPKR